MEIQYQKHYSNSLSRDMEYKIYGYAGKPVLYFPCQGGRFFDFEAFGMADQWANWIDGGLCMVYSVDSIDNETYGDLNGDPRRRIQRHEDWYHYIVDELVPEIHRHASTCNGFDQPIITFGCSMGASHAANLFFRRPDLFSAVFAISGVYDSRLFFGDYMDDLLYQNTPVSYLANMPLDHPYIPLYNRRKMLFVVGQGAWENETRTSTAWLQSVLRNKGIHAQVDFWGYDVDHDWPWWYKMVAHYGPDFLC